MAEQKSKQRKPLPSSPDFVSIREVAAYCCVNESTVSRGAKKKTWPFDQLRRVHVGARVIFTRASFDHMRRVMKRAAEVLPTDGLPMDVGSIDEGRDACA